jgi:hypothetical protein
VRIGCESVGTDFEEDFVPHSCKVVRTGRRGCDVEKAVRQADDGGLDGGEAKAGKPAGNDRGSELEGVMVGATMIDGPLNVVVLQG